MRKRLLGEDDEYDEEDEEDEIEEEWATRSFLHHFEPASRKLLETFLAKPELGSYVRAMAVGFWFLEDAGDGERVLRTMVAPSSGLRRA